MVRIFTVSEQLTVVKIICIFFRSSPGIINDTWCVRAFASLMLSPHATVVCACAGALPSLSLVVPGFAFAVAIAYCNILIAFPPQSLLQIPSVVLMLDRLKQISTTMVGHSRFDDLAMDVLGALANCNFAVQKKVLNLAVSLLTPGNISNVLRLLKNELDLAATADIPIEYQQMLEEAIRECHSAYPDSIMQFVQHPKYLVFIDCICYIKDIMDRNPMLRAQLLEGLLRALRHVKSSAVCAAAVWAISVCSESMSKSVALLMQFRSSLMTYWLDVIRRKRYLKQEDGSYTIASSSKSSSSSEDVFRFIPSLDHTDNLHFLVHSGDALLADFVENILSNIEEKAKEFLQ
uniref:Clathrin/coatomer adaptor adaptin-like N-terminal domain-containing protein n=1 Tax=Setaria italica TaxID=4555 RepID=K4A1L5_SETIT